MAGNRGAGESKARSKRRAGVADELRRRIEWIERSIAEQRASGAPVTAMLTEASAMREALAIVEERTLPERPPMPEPTPAVLDEWRQLGAWSPGRQVALLCDVLARLCDGYDDTARVTGAFRAAHHAERTRAKARA